jgi:hypothetical protein
MPESTALVNHYSPTIQTHQHQHQTHQYQTHHQTHHQSQHYGPLLTTRRIAYVSAYTTPELIGVLVSMP